MRRLFLILAACTGLAACDIDPAADLAAPVDPLGDFRLGFAEVVAPNLTKLLVSYDVTAEEWIEAVDAAVEARFARFEGTRFYHFGISVEEYSVPPPVVPGRSALAVRVTVWDDAREAKMNAETEVISVIRVIESRIAGTREERIDYLAKEIARRIEQWLRDQMAEEGWFEPQPDAEPAAATVPEETPAGTGMPDAPEAEPPADAAA